MSVSRRDVAAWAAIAALVAASWVWAVGRLAGPAAAHDLAFWLGIAAAVAALTAVSVAWGRFSGNRRRTTLAAACVLLVAASGAAAGAHFAGSPVSGTVTVQTNSGLAVSVDGASEMLLTDPQTGSDTANIVTESGNMTVTASGSAAVTVAASEIEGPWTNVTGVTATPNSVQLDPADKPSVTMAQDIDSFNYTGGFAVDDGTVDFVYSGASGQSEVTISGVVTNQQIRAVDRDSGNILDTASSDGSGSITFDALTNSQHVVLLQTGSSDDPVLSNPSPTGAQTSKPSTISIDVNDSEFSQGDSITVTIDLDGSQIHQTTISSNQTVSTSIPSSGQTGGAHDWTVEADPDFGNTVTESYQYSVPDTLYVRNASNHSQLVKSPISVDGTFFSDQQIIERDGITDGTINMTGLPVADSWIVEVETNGTDYTSRALWIPSIYQQQSIYLLNTSAYPTVESRFVLNDPTGVYSSESILFVQRPINVSGKTTWQTVHSDAFGTEGVTTVLEQDQRYRIRIRNEDGQEQIVGPYRADVGETVEVVPGAPSIERGDFVEGFTANAELINDGQTLQWRYNDTHDATDQLTVWIHERGNQSNRLVANATFFDLGSASASHSLSASQQNVSWDVVFIIDRNNSEFTHRIPTGAGASGLFAVIGENWRTMIGVGSLFMIAGVFSVLNASIGAVIVALIGGLWWFVGLLPGATSGIAIVLAMLLAVLNWARSRGGP